MKINLSIYINFTYLILTKKILLIKAINLYIFQHYFTSTPMNRQTTFFLLHCFLMQHYKDLI